MYEKFTDRARRVLHLANQEAQRFNHEYVGTEHVLLGLTKESSGIAGTVLKDRGITIQDVRREAEMLPPPGCDMITTGEVPLNTCVKKAIEYSAEEARSLGHNKVGTEHLLLGMLRMGLCHGVRVLMNLGLKLEEVREEVRNLLGTDKTETTTYHCQCRFVAGKSVQQCAYHERIKDEANELPAEIERLNLELAQAKYRSGAACGYCSHSGSLMLAEIKRLRRENRQFKRRAVEDFERLKSTAHD